jgi:hypothetical protein
MLATAFGRVTVIAIAVTAMLMLAAVPLAIAETIGFSPGAGTVDPGSTATFQIVMDSFPKGLAGYEIEVSIASPDKAEITDVSFPSWAGLNEKGSLPTDKVRLSGVDINKQVEKGSTNVVLATITVRGDSPGDTKLEVAAVQVDADGGDAIVPAAGSGQLTVRGTTATGTASPAPSPGLVASAAAVVLAGAVTLVVRRRQLK